jgi:small GTP-binding protein
MSKKTGKEELLPQYNVVVIGAGGTGKSCITNQFVTGVFTEDYDPTIEDSYRKRVAVDGEMCVLDILDTAGQEEYSSMLDEYLRHGQGFIIVYSIVSNQSFLEVQNFKDKLWLCKDLGPNDTIPLLLVGNKCDLETERKVTSTEGQELAKHLSCPFFETSAKTGLNVHEVFHEIVRQVRKDIEKKGLTPQKTEAPNEAYMAKLMKKFERWTLGLHLKEKMKNAKDQIKSLFQRSKSMDKDPSDIGSPQPTTPTPITPSQPTLSQSQNAPIQSTPPPQSQPVSSSPNPMTMPGSVPSPFLKASSTTNFSQPPRQQENNDTQMGSGVPPNSYGKIPKLEQNNAPTFYHYPWFHAHMSSSEADTILSNSPPGTFLIRPSSQPEHLAVTYVGDNRQLNKALIAYDKEGKNFWMAAEENPLRYPTLGRLVESLGSILRIPYTSNH